MRSNTLLIANLALLAALSAGGQAATAPNVVLILADDLGYGDPHCNNPERGKIPTPSLDKLAAQGMRFTDAHSSSSVCSPTRYTLLTGRYHWRTRLQQGIVGPWEAPLIAPNRLTLASLAKRHGYATAAIGKWHLGWNWPIAADQARHFSGLLMQKEARATAENQAAWKEVFAQPISGGPTTRGFDSYFGTDVPNWPPYCFIANDHTVGIPSMLLPAGQLTNNLAGRQGPALPEWSLHAILPALGDKAVEFITTKAAGPDPFLLYLPLTAPHTPIAVNEAWRGKSGLGAYADFVMETDALVGRVLEALDKTAAANSTLVIFTSDNGCATLTGPKQLEAQGHFPSGPLRGYKTDAWEGGHRIPFLVRWPGSVQAGSTCDQLVHHADVLATLADILGAKLPADAGEDSVSFLPLLRGGREPTRTTAVSHSAQGVATVRSGAWKFIAGPDKSAASQLYNLADDLGETNNLAGQEPQRVAEMIALLERFVEQGRSTPGEKQANDVPVQWKRHLQPPPGNAPPSGKKAEKP